MPVTASRLSPRSAPTKSATNGLAGLPSSSAGVANCSTCPPWLMTAIRSPSRTASSMSWVTNTIVLRTLGLQPQELRLQPVADDRVDGAERLVHQQHRRVGGQRPGHADALPLAAGELGGVAVAVDGGVEADRGRAARRPASRMRLRSQPSSRGTVPTFVAHGLVREEADVLDDVADPAAQLVGVDAGDVLAAEQDPAGGRLDEPVDHLHRRRLAAARGADQHA